MTFGDSLSKRHRKILDLLTVNTAISVTELSKKLEVSSTKIRDDLKSLETKGLILRSRGNALPAFHTEITNKQSKTLAARRDYGRTVRDQGQDL